MKTKIKKMAKAAVSALYDEAPRYLPALAMICFCSLTMSADVFDDIATDISEYMDGVKKVIYAVAAIIALVGAFNIYHKMTNGDQDVKKTVMLTIGGCIGLLAMAEALPAFFTTGGV